MPTVSNRSPCSGSDSTLTPLKRAHADSVAASPARSPSTTTWRCGPSGSPMPQRRPISGAASIGRPPTKTITSARVRTSASVVVNWPRSCSARSPAISASPPPASQIAPVAQASRYSARAPATSVPRPPNSGCRLAASHAAAVATASSRLHAEPSSVGVAVAARTSKLASARLARAHSPPTNASAAPLGAHARQVVAGQRTKRASPALLRRDASRDGVAHRALSTQAMCHS